MTTRNSTEVQRKIQFYRVRVGDSPSMAPQSAPFDPEPALQKIYDLPFANINNQNLGRYQFVRDGNALAVWPATYQGRFPRLRFCRVRRNGLPLEENGGVLSGLSLTPTSGLAEPIHVVFFPNNIVGAEYNHYGPRLSALGDYLHEKSDRAVERARFCPLLRTDLLEQLEQFETLRLFELRLNQSYDSIMRSIDRPLADSLNYLQQDSPHVKTLTLYLTLDAPKDSAPFNRFMGIIRRLVRDDRSVTTVERLRIRGKSSETQRVEPLDLLRSYVVTERSMTRIEPRNRALDEVSAFEAIEKAYRDFGNSLANLPDVEGPP